MMFKLVDNIKKHLKIKSAQQPDCQHSSHSLVPRHLSAPDREEDGFCLVGQTISERSTVGPEDSRSQGFSEGRSSSRWYIDSDPPPPYPEQVRVKYYLVNVNNK